MLQIQCPWCGKRDETEFCCGGESHIIRPIDPARASDVEWADYQFNRINPKGLHRERWRHTHGCRQWFNLARDTVSHDIVAIYQMTETYELGQPAAPADKELPGIEEARLSASQ